MLCFNPQDQWAYPLECSSVSPFSQHRKSIGSTIPLSTEANCLHSSDSLDSQPHRHWPWRLLPFASDLGTIGYLLKRPKLGILGWAIAMPYYLYAISKQPDAHQRKEEMLYQVTANGVFPIIEGKIGVKLGGILHQIASKNRMNVTNALKQSHCKLLGGLLGLIALTSTLGDPISHQICNQYQSRKLDVTA